jgi:hypothetical protein
MKRAGREIGGVNKVSIMLQQLSGVVPNVRRQWIPGQFLLSLRRLSNHVNI